MIKYAQIANEETKQVNVGVGTDSEFYKSIGMTEMDVEHCEWDGNWYLAGYVPEEPAEQVKAKQLASLKGQLLTLDEKSNRSMRAILAGTATEDDRTFLANLEEQATELRRQIHELEEEVQQ